MPDLIQSASWPGVLAVESCQYVCSHGISPGRAVLVTYPQTAAPEEFGALTFSDGTRTITIPGCKVDRITPQITPNGFTYTLEILDKRWQWLALGGISGHYNQKDRRGKLVPWSIRSPEELAKLCLAAMGETNFALQLPPGLTAAAGANLNSYLKLGENYPQTLTNPEAVWEHTPPAGALAQLAELYGCRVVYQPISNRVLVVPLGQGQSLPNLPCEVIGATIDAPESPVAVGVYGAPVKIQARFLLEAVGEEWDGSFVPINQLSYAPVVGGKQQVSRVKETGDGSGIGLVVSVTYTNANGMPKSTIYEASIGGANADKFKRVGDLMTADPQLAAVITAASDATGITLTAKAAGTFSLRVTTDTGGDSPWATTALISRGSNPRRSWDYSNPPQFTNVQATDRLSYAEARALAQSSVFRCYRILNRDPSDLGPPNRPGQPMILPWYGQKYGPIVRRQQILLQETKVEQVVPQGRIPGAVNKGNALGNAAIDIPGQGLLPEFYNGYSRDRAATVTGRIFAKIGNANWLFLLQDGFDKGLIGAATAITAGTAGLAGAALEFNTPANSRVPVGFHFNQQEQMIVFDEAVFAYEPMGGAFSIVNEPVLTLETGCFVLDAVTNQVIRWEEQQAIPGGVAPTEWSYHEDVQAVVYSDYDDENKLRLFSVDAGDARARAAYYLAGQALKYQTKGGETRQYIGIVPHEPDGYTQQVSWSVGAGATTTVGANTEFHPMVAPYPARRRAENLPPKKAAAAANIQERALLAEALGEVKK